MARHNVRVAGEVGSMAVARAAPSLSVLRVQTFGAPPKQSCVTVGRPAFAAFLAVKAKARAVVPSSLVWAPAVARVWV